VRGDAGDVPTALGCQRGQLAGEEQVGEIRLGVGAGRAVAAGPPGSSKRMRPKLAIPEAIVTTRGPAAVAGAASMSGHRCAVMSTPNPGSVRHKSASGSTSQK
jgi:hypothetical protein